MKAGKSESDYPQGNSGPDELCEVAQKWRCADENASPEQVEIYRRMTPGQRLEIAERLYWSARDLKKAWLRTLHADWTDAEIEAEVIRNFSNARS